MEKKLGAIKLKASGQAISKVCYVADVLRRRIKGLHMQQILSNIKIEDEYEPKEEGLDRVVIERVLTVFEVVLALDISKVDVNHYGYQAPLPEEDVKEFPLDFGGNRQRRPEENKDRRRTERPRGRRPRKDS